MKVANLVGPLLAITALVLAGVAIPASLMLEGTGPRTGVAGACFGSACLLALAWLVLRPRHVRVNLQLALALGSAAGYVVGLFAMVDCGLGCRQDVCVCRDETVLARIASSCTDATRVCDGVCIGHGSGRRLDGAEAQEALQRQYRAIEECVRAGGGPRCLP